MQSDFILKQHLIPLLMSRQENLDDALSLLDAMTTTAGITGYCNVSSIGPFQRTVDVGIWLNEGLAIRLGRVSAFSKGGSRAAMIARLKTGEIIVSDSSEGVISTPIIGREDRGGGWQGGVGQISSALGISAFTQEVDKFLATIGFYQLVRGGLYLASTALVPASEEAYAGIYAAAYPNAQSIEDSCSFEVAGVPVRVRRAIPGEVPYCRWEISGPKAAGLIAFLKEVFKAEIHVEAIDINGSVVSIHNNKEGDDYRLFQVVIA